MAPNHLGSTDHSITLRHLANSGWNSSNLEPPVVAVSARLVRWVGSEWDRISSSRLAPGQGGISPHSSRHQARRWRMSGLSRYIRSEEHTSELQSPYDLVCRLLLEKKK